MKSKIINNISFLLILSIILNALIPTLTYASESIDYKDLVQDNIAAFGYFITPRSQFEVYVNGSKKATSPSGTSIVETVAALPPSFTAKVGDQIRIQDISQPGSGSSIVARDLQIGKNYTWNGPEEFIESSSGNLTITADKPGEWVVFLNVRDNYTGVPNFQNWSQYGNWRTTARPAYEPPGVKIEGWYFSALKFTVEDTSVPKAEFEIHHNGQNKTDNFSNVVELESYPASVNLIDESMTEQGNISSWEWERKINGSWVSESSSKNPTATVNQNVEVFRLRVKNASGEISSWVEHTFYSKLKGQPDPEPEIPTKPDVIKPSIDIWIEPRDNDPNTPSDEIYEGEHIQIEGLVINGDNPKWSFRAKGSNQSGSDVISGLFPTSEPDDEAYAEQIARYDDYVLNDNNEYVKKRITVEETVNFIVKEIQPPKIDISGDLTDSNLNIVHIKEPTNIITNVYDINEPSEEHPNGFDVVEESWKFIKKSTGQVALQGVGTLNNSEFIFEKGVFETNEYYIFRTTAYNAFKPIRRTEKDIEIFVENLPPIVNLKITSEDKEAPTFAKEYFDINVDAIDKDGYIFNVNVDVLNNYPQLKHLGKTEHIQLYRETYKGDYRYISDIANVITFRVTAFDDRGAETILDIKENIVRPSVYADIKVTNEQEIQKKVYRFIELDFTDSYENAPFGIDHTKNIIKYRHNNGEWNDIADLQNYSDEIIRVYYPNYPIKDKLEMYAKKDGDIEFSLKVFDKKGFDSEEVYKTLTIINDEAPLIDYDIESMNHRITEDDIKNYKDRTLAITQDNLDKGYIKIIDKSRSIDGDELLFKVIHLIYDAHNDGIDNDIEYELLVTKGVNGFDSNKEILLNLEESNIIEVSDLNNIMVTFLTQEDGLGNYYIKETVKEKITQLPSLTSPLYSEILNHQLITTNDYSNVFIDNLLPTITFEIGIDKEINLIVHYDDYIPTELQNKINDLILNLESRGLKVRLIKYENKY